MDAALRSAERHAELDPSRLTVERLRAGRCPGCGQAATGNATCRAARAAAGDPSVTMSPPPRDDVRPTERRGAPWDAADRREADDLGLAGWRIVSKVSDVYDVHGLLREDRHGAWRDGVGRSFQRGFRGKRARWNVGWAFLPCQAVDEGLPAGPHAPGCSRLLAPAMPWCSCHEVVAAAGEA